MTGLGTPLAAHIVYSLSGITELKARATGPGAFGLPARPWLQLTGQVLAPGSPS